MTPPPKASIDAVTELPSRPPPVVARAWPQNAWITAMQNKTDPRRARDDCMLLSLLAMPWRRRDKWAALTRRMLPSCSRDHNEKRGQDGCITLTIDHKLPEIVSGNVN